MEDTIERIIKKQQEGRNNIISILQDIDSIYGYIPEEVVCEISRRLDIPAAKFFGIATFYSHFRMKPKGKNTITVCCGAACHIKGSAQLIEHLRELISLEEGEDTTEDLSFTLQETTCIGACNIAPIVLVNKKVHGNMDKEKLSKLIKGYTDEEEFIGY